MCGFFICCWMKAIRHICISANYRLKPRRKEPSGKLSLVDGYRPYTACLAKAGLMDKIVGEIR
jgi:hypothetical protein